MPEPVSAQTMCNENFYSDNNIPPFYTPCAISCSVTSSGSTGPVSNPVDYRNRTIFNDTQLQQLEAHTPFYKIGGQKAGIPWQMIAVTHYRESSFKRTNPSNGEGLFGDFQKVGGPYPAGPVDDAGFQKQVDWAAEFLKSKAGDRAGQLKTGDDAAVKYTFFAYNGVAQAYVDQALRLGFTAAQASIGEGSPYVMNKADPKRDPTTNKTTWGQIKTNGGTLQYPANADYGSFVLYAAITGGISGTGSCGTDGAGGVLTEGGLSEDQAKRFVINYGKNIDGFSASTTGALWSMCQGSGSNCVTFSYFFNKAFTDLPVAMNDGNGNAIVKSLAAKGVSTGSQPKVFSTFSSSNGGAGHTGIVLGIQGDTIITAHASCSAGGSGGGDGVTFGDGAAFIRVGKRTDPKTWLGPVPTEFAYPESVDTGAIETFINK
ncbi:MAG: CHAP domain-containing protein [Candidatus Saccharimonadales bacterium]